jgi:chitodextrinase
MVTGGDSTPPSVPAGLSASAISSSQINLTWIASTDNVGVTGYKVFRNGSQIATTATNSYQNTGLTAGTTYSYTVSAYDAAGNNSAQSTSVSGTTQTSLPTGVPQPPALPTLPVLVNPVTVAPGYTNGSITVAGNATQNLSTGVVSGTDDTAAWQNIINSHDVIVQAGTYAIAGYLELPTGRNISCQPGATFIQTGDGN